MASTPAAAGLEWGVASKPLEGDISGDLQVVVRGGDSTLLAVIDGLGHGREACRAAEECATLLRQHAGRDLSDLIQRCHEGLRSTRGVALTVAHVYERHGFLDWMGVGNVEGVVWRESSGRGRVLAAVVSRGGVVGYRLPPLKSSRVTLIPGDLIAFATDGVSASFVQMLDASWSAQELADSILARFGKATDDALVLVSRHRGIQVS